MFTLWSALLRRVLLTLHLRLLSARSWLYRAHRDQTGSASEYAIIAALGILLALGIFAILQRVVFDYTSEIPAPGQGGGGGGGA